MQKGCNRANGIEDTKNDGIRMVSKDDVEDTEHFLLLCPSFNIQGRDFLAGVLALVRPFGLGSPSNEALTRLLMYGNKDSSDEIN